MKRIIILLISAAFTLNLAAQKKVVESKTHYAQDALKPFVETGELSGAISIFYKDGVQETCCIGYADVEAKRPISLNNVFMQCSQTKGFCGVTIAKLVEEGKISLDDPVYKYLPEFKVLWVLEGDADGVRTLRRAKNVLTVRMVMNHTGGFPFENVVKRNNVKGGGWNGGAPIRQVAVVAAAMPLMFEPGTKVQYSNTGIDIGAAIVEAVTGMSWDEYLKKAVLDPLGMKSTTFWPTDKQLKEKIELYNFVEKQPAEWREEMAWMPAPHNGPRVFPSAGAGLWTTAADQLKFYKMLMNLGIGDNGVRILKEETVKLMTVDRLADEQKDAYWPKDSHGYGLGVRCPKGDKRYIDFGWGGAAGAFYAVDLENELSLYFGMQLLWSPVHGLRSMLYRFVRAELIDNSEFEGLYEELEDLYNYKLIYK